MARALEGVLGRRNMVRLSRYLLDHARLDVRNALDTNGELQLQRAVLEMAKGAANPVVFDVGANVGQWLSRLLAEAARQGVDGLDVHAFEPSPYTYERLRENLGSEAVHVNRVAVSDSVGEATLYEAHRGAGSNSLYERDDRPVTAQVVETTTVDAYCRQRGIDDILLLKSDAEGHDFSVLRGAAQMLESGRVGVVQFEYNHRWIAARAFLRDAFEYLGPLGYSIGKLTPYGVEWYARWDPELETFREGNYVARSANRALPLPSVRWWKCP
jgi:FkbM family methyltransferase